MSSSAVHAQYNTGLTVSNITTNDKEKITYP